MVGQIQALLSASVTLLFHFLFGFLEPEFLFIKWRPSFFEVRVAMAVETRRVSSFI